MLQTRILYICLLFMMAFYYVFSDQYIALFLCLFTVLFGFVMFIYSFGLKNKVGAFVTAQSFSAKRKDAYITVILKNESIFPITYLTSTLVIENKLTKQVQERMLTTSLGSYGKKEMTICVNSEFSCVLQITLQDVYSFDFLKLFKKRSIVEAGAMMTMMPNMYDSNQLDAIATTNIAEVASFVSERKGNLQEEIIGIKPYVPGDNIKHIHWKLSSKLDELLIKELADVREEKIVVLLETSIDIEGDFERIQTIDRMMDTFVSVTKQFLDEDKELHLAWYDDDTQKIHQKEMFGHADLQGLLQNVLSVPIGRFATTTYEQFLLQMQEDAVVLYVTTELNKNVSSMEGNASCIPIYAESWLDELSMDAQTYEGQYK